MKQTPERGKARGDVDGVRVIRRDGHAGDSFRVPLVGGAVLVVLAALLIHHVLDRPRTADRPPADPAPPVAAVAERPAVAPSEPARTERSRPHPARRRVHPRRRAPSDEAAAPDAPAAQARPEIDARDYIAALRASGETEGLAAFPPPGTSPPRSGVVVPDDYQLPEGFARHYQTTDDGRRLDPVLVLAPEYDLLDDAGNRIALGDDRIVPPELAPPDLPVRLLDVPPAPPRGPDAR